MQKFIVVALVLSCSAACWAGAGVMAGPMPEGWFVYRDPAGTRYQAFLDRSTAFEGEACAVLDSLGAPDVQFATLMQAIDASSYQGRRVRLLAHVQSKQANNAWLWLRADRADGTVVAFDNMSDRRIEGTLGWQAYVIVLDIPTEAVTLAYGVGLRGGGKIWLDDVFLEEVGPSVPVTAAAGLGPHKAPVPEALVLPAPANLGLEH